MRTTDSIEESFTSTTTTAALVECENEISPQAGATRSNIISKKQAGRTSERTSVSLSLSALLCSGFSSTGPTPQQLVVVGWPISRPVPPFRSVLQSRLPSGSLSLSANKEVERHQLVAWVKTLAIILLHCGSRARFHLNQFSH